jgi:hypothetical protein
MALGKTVNISNTKRQNEEQYNAQGKENSK